jgi:hypothetical protein
MFPSTFSADIGRMKVVFEAMMSRFGSFRQAQTASAAGFDRGESGEFSFVEVHPPCGLNSRPGNAVRCRRDQRRPQLGDHPQNVGKQVPGIATSAIWNAT